MMHTQPVQNMLATADTASVITGCLGSPTSPAPVVRLSFLSVNYSTRAADSSSCFGRYRMSSTLQQTPPLSRKKA